MNGEEGRTANDDEVVQPRDVKFAEAVVKLCVDEAKDRERSEAEQV